MHIAAAVFMRDQLMCGFVNRSWRRRLIFSVHHYPQSATRNNVAGLR
jgi:hypothetical protein